MKLFKVLAFIKRDYKILISYKIAFITSILGTIFPLLSYFFISKLVPDHQESLVKYGGDYFAFTIIGVAFTTYFTMALQQFSANIRRDQMAGCLEALLSSQTDTKSLIFMSAIFRFLFNGLILIFMFILSIVFLGFDFSKINIPSFILALLLSLVIFVSLGIFSAAGTVRYKQGEPFALIFATLGSLFGGAIFPISLLPVGFKIFSYIIPITYSLEALRLSILQGYTIGMLSQQLLILFCIALVVLPLSLKFFDLTIEKGKKDGTLMQY